MIKNFVIIFYNKINNSTNFNNFIIQINLKIKKIKIKSFLKNHIKIILFNDSFYKINQFLKSLSKCFSIKKIFSYEKIKCINYNNFNIKKDLKFFKNFIFISYIKNYILFFNLKKLNYVKSIVNISFFNNNVFL